MNNQCIIHKRAGFDIPRGYLQVALKNCPDYLGMAIQDKESETGLETSADVKTHDLEDVCKTLAQLKDIPVTIQLGKMEQDFDKNTDMMPYVFQQAGESGADPTNILAVFIEGDIPNYSKPGAGHTEEYNFWEDFLYPTILEKFEASQDVEDFFSRMRKSNFQQAVEHPMGHRGVAVFVPMEGEIIAYGKNDIGLDLDWGTASQSFGWGSQTKLEEATASTVAAVKKAGGRLARALGTTAVAAPPAGPVVKPEEKKENPPGVHTTPDAWSKWPGTSSKTHKMVKVPDGLQGNAKNRWIRIFLGLTPNDELPKGKDYKDFTMPVPLELMGFAQEDHTTNDAVKSLASRVLKFQGKAGNADAPAIGDQMKEAVEEKNPADPNQVARPAADFLPEVSAEENLIGTNLVTEWATNPKRPSSLDVQRIESKWPLFSATKGIKLADVAHWSMAEKKTFTKKCPNDAARLISELMLKLHEYGEFKDDDKKVVVPDKQVEVPPAKPMATPAKGGRLARAKGVAA